MRRVLRSFGPVVVSRGVVQLSAYVDQLLASYLGPAAVAAMAYAQMLYLLPISLFGMAISAAELPGDVERGRRRTRRWPRRCASGCEAALARMAFFVVPSVVAFLALGDVVVAPLYPDRPLRRAHDTRFVWTDPGRLDGRPAGGDAGPAVLVGVLRARRHRARRSGSRVVRVALTAALRLGLRAAAARAFGWPPQWGAAGLTAIGRRGAAGSSSCCSSARWTGRIGHVPIGGARRLRAWLAALVGAGAAFALHHLAPIRQPVVAGVVVLGLYGALYLALAHALGLPEARQSSAARAACGDRRRLLDRQAPGK